MQAQAACLAQVGRPVAAEVPDVALVAQTRAKLYRALHPRSGPVQAQAAPRSRGRASSSFVSEPAGLSLQRNDNSP